MQTAYVIRLEICAMNIRLYMQQLNPSDPVVYCTKPTGLMGVAALVYFGGFAVAVGVVVLWLVL